MAAFLQRRDIGLRECMTCPQHPVPPRGPPVSATLRTRHPGRVPPLREAPVRLTRSTLRRAAVGIAAAGLATASLLAPTAASATPALSATGASALATQLGTRSAGFYQGSNGRMVIAVTDAAAASTVRAAGADAQLVSRSGAALE